MTIAQTLKQTVKPAYVELYVLDLSPLGGPIFYLTPSTNAGANGMVSFGGQEYTPIPITGSGWTTAIDGSPPQPSLTISNVTKFIQSYLTLYKDARNAVVTRTLTFAPYLDDGATPDSTQTFGTSVYLIEQKTRASKYMVEFKLRSVIDAPLAKLPRQQVLRSEFPGAGLFRKQ